MESRTLYSRPELNWYPILASIVFVMIGIWMILDGVWWGWLELGLWSFGLVVLIVRGFSHNFLRLEADGFRLGHWLNRSKLAWSDVERFFLTADGQTVVYELMPNPGETSEDPDEYFAHFPSTYGLTAPELLELLQRYKLASSTPT
jgi:hypothetical protein